ncbi:rhotekin-2 isoform X2 [Periophthalmus magnuspinnatus]|uniref:rhotekin-2 isoform X2 n=1 Tax=Periophthalmus magnuspinnatus TaxID=409849 RepID=UPI0024371C03|nr:rhotekin-2 isoform X2 [Periophthalmus magnuspinnatus]
MVKGVDQPHLRPLSKELQDADVQKKLDFEMRMREGAYRLLLACTKREQVLNAAKNLHTSNARVKAYVSEVHRRDAMDVMDRLTDSRIDERKPCPGTVALSGLRIPLLWRDSDHFNNRGSSRRAALFCLVQVGSEVFDTEMVVVDRSMTDVCFEGVTLFKEALPQFELKVELWSCALEEELALVNTPKKLAKKFRSSFGKSSGKKLSPLLDTPDPEAFLQYNPVPPGSKFNLLAYTTLRLPQAEGSFQSHSLIVVQNAEWSSWLPLYGNLCCRLVAQPVCMTQSVRAGHLCQKLNVEGLSRSRLLYCDLSAGLLSCYFTPEEIQAKVSPTLKLPINQDTRIHVLETGSMGQRLRTLSIHSPTAEASDPVTFSTESREELDEWVDALHQHLYDQSQWLHCCDQLMKIELLSPRKPSLFLTKEADSVYNDLSINSPSKFESITDLIHDKIEQTDGRFLIGHEERREAPNWSSLFDGSQSVLVQKSVLSQSKTSTPYSSPLHNKTTPPGSVKKRRAPPPPTNQEPYTPPARPARPPPPAHPPVPVHEKENANACTSRPTPRSKTGRPSLDAKFSSIIQQLQRNNASGASALTRKNAPLGVLEIQPPSQEFEQHPNPDANEPRFVRPACGTAPVPAPRGKLRKSFRDRISLKPL